MDQKSNIVLIGMSGAGKSTLGVLLAKALGKSFADTDILIQQKDGRLLQDMIDSDGTDAFLRVEEETVCEVTAKNTVIATGGSVVYSEKAMTALKREGVCVYLHVDFDELSTRLKNITTRGIVFKNANSLRQVYEERLPLYERYADITVYCTGRSIEESIEKLVVELKQRREL